MPDHADRRRPALANRLGDAAELVLVLEQTAERSRLLADLGEELRAGGSSRAPLS